MSDLTTEQREALVAELGNRFVAEQVLRSNWLARLLAEREAEALERAAQELMNKAVLQFDQFGVDDARGAAIWDSAAWLRDRATPATPAQRGKVEP